LCAERNIASDLSDFNQAAALMHLPEREFFFLRHGETEYNREGRFQGHIDVPLNSAGFAQAESAVDVLSERKISRVVSSPARRVLQTVQPFMQADEIPLHIEDDLMEFFVGGFEGQLVADVRQAHGLDRGKSWLTVLPDDAECWREFVSRVCSAVGPWTTRHSDETLLIASHGLVFRALAEVLTGTQLSIRNAEAHYFRPVGEGWAVSRVSA
jgi:broad specificity phosphatase PhoE